MALNVYNVRTRQKEPFQPIDPEGKQVGMYVCGLTVYDHMHIGHARTAVSFEVIRRWLERSYELRYVQNVTDVDDKIIKRAVELGVSPLEHAATWDRKCLEAVARLGVRPPDEAPHATTSMAGIITFIEGILERGYAYATGEGNVYFDVPSYDEYARQEFPDAAYGSLSRRDYREMAAGTRKEVEGDKRHPADFALWKAAKDDEPEDAQWESPWGRGRPGWHIECSHMSTHSLGANRIDIHGGGQDLIFPHHENEIAQSQAKTGQAPFVNVWMHTGFLNVEGQKMSKSLHNFIVLNELLDEMEDAGVDPEVLRFYFVQTHYRSKIDFSRKGLDEAAVAVERLNRTRRRLAEEAARDRIGCADVDPPLLEAAATLAIDFATAMDDDFHSPSALATLFTFQKAANQAIDSGLLGSQAAKQALAAFEDAGSALTLFQGPAIPEDADAGGEIPEGLSSLLASLGLEAGADEASSVEVALQAREAARAAKDWDRADAVRDGLAAAGYIIEDTPQGPRWSRK